MRRKAVFDRGRGWRVEDEDYRSLHLGPDRGAALGQYAERESAEYSDSYYGPGDDYPYRDFTSGGYSRGETQPTPPFNPRPGGVVGRLAPEQLLPSFRGRGPKGSKRTDERLREIICDRLTDDPRIDASGIMVEVSNGEVTLTGTVDYKRARWLAEEVADACGVTVVHNSLRVR